MKTEQAIKLKTHQALTLASIFCAVVWAWFFWQLQAPPNPGLLPIIAGGAVCLLYQIIKFCTYGIVLYDDRIVRKLWWRKDEILYKDIRTLSIDGSSFDAYQLSKTVNPSGLSSLKKYQIYNVLIKDSRNVICFRTKWFDSLELNHAALALLYEKCPPGKFKRKAANTYFLRWQYKICFLAMVKVYVLIYIASFFFE